MASIWTKVAGRRRGAATMALMGLVLAAAVGIGVFFVSRFVESERQRDLQAWQVRLSIVADSRLAAVNNWLEQQFAELTGLAENASLQLYMTELSLAGGDRSAVTDEPAQAGYLRNLLLVTAERAGFTGKLVGPEVSANVQRLGVAGLALVDIEGRVIAATPDMPPLEGRLRDFAQAAPRGERALLDLHRGATGTPTMGFLAPIFAVQGDPVSSAQLGVVVGVKEVGRELFPLLRQPGAVEETAETILVRARGAVVEYLSPLKDGTPALERSLARDTPELAAAFGITTPGGFATRHDYRNAEVLAVGRAVAAAPWTLIYKIDTAEALVESRSRRNRLMTFFLLTIAVVAAAIVAVWRHGTSVRASEAAHQARELARRFEEQRNFLHLVTDSQPNTIAIIDKEGRYRWVNRPTWEAVGLSRIDMINKTLASVVGPVPAKALERTIRDVFDSGMPVVETHKEERDGTVKTFQSEFIPLPATQDKPSEVLMVSEDVTATVEEREKRERLMQQLITTLVNVVDRRDPYSANHSARVAKVARAIAAEMDLSPVEVETIATAGAVMNLGKIMVPQELLTKAERLTEEELKQIRDSIQTSADLLEGVEFEGPVVETLRQLQERWDGSGRPRGIKGEEILITARIVAVANAFVALVSPRAHRPGVGFDEAVETLLGEIGRTYDRREVAALVNYLDNRGGRQRWSEFLREPTTS